MTHNKDIAPWTHSHEFAAVDPGNERRTMIVVILTAVMMVVEVVAGTIYGSMALLADGWHMATHVAALGIAVFAYGYARRHKSDPRFTFGTGKVGVLGGFASATALAVVALMMIGESTVRFFTKLDIRFDEAIVVAVIGLVVNVVSAVILGVGHRHSDHDHHEHGHGHEHSHHRHGRDHNLRAAYMHVIADAFTSVLAIVALTAGKLWGQVWMDPMMGLIGGGLIARWSYGLIRDTGRILLDAVAETKLLDSIKSTITEDGADKVADLHVWRVGPETYGAILSVVTESTRTPNDYKAMLKHIHGLAHVTVEVQRVGKATNVEHPTSNFER